MEKRDLILDGSAKRLFSTERENLAILEFKDDFVSENGAKKAKIPGKGEINTGITSFLFQYLENYHVPTHFIERINPVEMLVRRLKMIPIEVAVHNIASSTLSERFGVPEGEDLDFPIIEYFLKRSDLGQPMINETHALALGYARTEDIRAIGRMASKANAILKSMFERRGLMLVEFKLEFGSVGDNIYIGDEISPDTCKIWDKKKNRKLDRERFAHDLGSVEKAYKELFDRLTRSI